MQDAPGLKSARIRAFNIVRLYALHSILIGRSVSVSSYFVFGVAVVDTIALSAFTPFA